VPQLSADPLGGDLMKNFISIILLLFSGCFMLSNSGDTVFIASDRLQCQSPFGAKLPFAKYVGRAIASDSAYLGKSVVLSSGFQLGEQVLEVSFDTVLYKKSSRTLSLSGRIADKVTGETWVGVMILHLSTQIPCQKFREQPFEAKLLNFTSSDSTGFFHTSFIFSPGDILVFDDVGYSVTICCLDGVLQ
jgi:hypothetical protein